MKNFLYILLVLPFLGLAQSTDQNWVKTVTYKDSTKTSISNPTPTQTAINVGYFDGLGRPIQKIAHKQSNTEKDIVTHIEYDSLGRQSKEFLPFKSSLSASLDFKPNETLSFYASTDTLLTGSPNFENTNFPYNEKQFEASPLNRVLKQAAPGDAWKINSGHEIKFEYQANSDADNVKLFKVTTTWSDSKGLYDIAIVQNGNYSINQLYKTITKDENWTSSSGSIFTTEEFKDKEGRVVLKRSYSIVNNTTEAHDTYYVYDLYGNLAYVIPPLANGDISENSLNGLCYQYKYDNRNRLAAKKLPGKQWEFMVYDRLDKVVATGPAYNPWGATDAGWLITEYDVFGRVIQTGWKTMTVNETTRKDNQNTINSGSNPFQLSANDILTKNYYDNYTFATNASLTIATDVESQTVASGTELKGLPTGSWVRLLDASGNTNGEISYTLYDYKSRPIRTYKKNYLGGYSQIDSKLDFIGKPLYTITKHKRLNGDTEIVVREDFTYNAQDKLVTHTHKIGISGTPQLLASNSYDELGQLISKNVGGEVGSQSLQKVDYAYNIRGWLKSINDITNLNPNANEHDMFAFKLNYNDPEPNTNALFNGNISETFWKTSSDNQVRKYHYEYDGLNRMKGAFYSRPDFTHPDIGSYDEKLEYDKNGNIAKLTRYGEYDDENYRLLIDDLAYVYDPLNKNQLKNVADGSTNPNGFKDVINSGDEFGYDLNGNMISDFNKSISVIKYNHLNLPTEITFSGTPTKKINYLYDTSGVKLQKKITNGSSITYIDYLSGFQYRKVGTGSVKLEFFPHAEGYVSNTVVNNVNNYNYVFNYTDHLGNSRLSYAYDNATSSIKILEENNYYPFGLKHNNYNMDKSYYEKVQSGEITILKGAAIPYKYKFNGQEHQDELGLNMTAMDWRQYDGAIGRFNSIDALAELETQLDISPYAFSWNNPVALSDPSGLCPECPEGKKDGQKYTSTGGANYVFNNGEWTRETQQLNEVVVEAKKKESNSSNEGQPGKKEGTTALFGLIQNANVNSEGQSPLEQYRERRDYDGYHPGEGKFDRIFRLMNSSHMEQMSDFGSGGHNMFGGYGRAVKGISVLGHYPEYVTLAEKINGRTFQIPTNVWNKMSATEQWTANLKFLNRMISRGDRIRLATPLNRVKQGSFYQKELNYLMSKGYRVSSDGLWLTK